MSSPAGGAEKAEQAEAQYDYYLCNRAGPTVAETHLASIKQTKYLATWPLLFWEQLCDAVFAPGSRGGWSLQCRIDTIPLSEWGACDILRQLHPDLLKTRITRSACAPGELPREPDIQLKRGPSANGRQTLDTRELQS